MELKADGVGDLYFAGHHEKFSSSETGVEAPALIDAIMSKKCAVSAILTYGDKANLLEIKEQAGKKFPASQPQPAGL